MFLAFQQPVQEKGVDFVIGIETETPYGLISQSFPVSDLFIETSSNDSQTSL